MGPTSLEKEEGEGKARTEMDPLSLRSLSEERGSQTKLRESQTGRTILLKLLSCLVCLLKLLKNEGFGRIGLSR